MVQPASSRHRRLQHNHKKASGFIATFPDIAGIEEADSDFRNQVRQPSFNSIVIQEAMAFTIGNALLVANVKP